METALHRSVQEELLWFFFFFSLTSFTFSKDVHTGALLHVSVHSRVRIHQKIQKNTRASTSHTTRSLFVASLSLPPGSEEVPPPRVFLSLSLFGTLSFSPFLFGVFVSRVDSHALYIFVRSCSQSPLHRSFSFPQHTHTHTHPSVSLSFTLARALSSLFFSSSSSSLSLSPFSLFSQDLVSLSSSFTKFHRIASPTPHVFLTSPPLPSSLSLFLSLSLSPLLTSPP